MSHSLHASPCWRDTQEAVKVKRSQWRNYSPEAVSRSPLPGWSDTLEAVKAIESTLDKDNLTSAELEEVIMVEKRRGGLKDDNAVVVKANQTLKDIQADSRIKELEGEKAKLREADAQKNAKLKEADAWIKELKSENAKLKEADAMIKELEGENAKLKEADARKTTKLKEADARIKELEAENAKLKEADPQIRKLEAESALTFISSKLRRKCVSKKLLFFVLPIVCLALALCWTIPSRRATFLSDSNVAAHGLAPMRDFGEFLHGEVANRIKQSVCTDGDTMSIVNSKQFYDLTRKEWDRHPTIQNSNSQLFLWDTPAPVVERTSKWIAIGQRFGLFGKSTHPKKPKWNRNLTAELWDSLEVVSVGFEINASTPYNKTFEHLMMLMMETQIPLNETENEFYGVGFKAEDHGINSFKQVAQHTLSLLHSLGKSTPRCCVIKDGRECHPDCNRIDVVQFQLPRRHAETFGLHDRNYDVEIRIGDKRSEIFQKLFGCAAEVLLT